MVGKAVYLTILLVEAVVFGTPGAGDLQNGVWRLLDGKGIKGYTLMWGMESHLGGPTSISSCLELLL